MGFIAPLALILGLLAGPIILLYMLRLRRQEMLVSSTLLWQKLLRDREANAPWQRLRRNLLLLLQLLVLALLVVALARPFLPVPAVVSGNVVVLLDGSASMLASDVAPNRFEAARQEVEALIDNLAGTDQMTIILAGRQPAVLAAATGDRRLLRTALAEARAETAPADWAAAVALASGAAQGFREAQVVVVSDGGLPDDLPPLPVEPIYRPIGSRAENLALSALATRGTEQGVQLFAGVANHGGRDQTALLSISLDGTLFDSRRLAIPAGGTASVTWSLPPDTATIEARLSDLSEDYLASDNEAWAVHEGGLTNRALLVTSGNLFLEQILAVLPGLETFKAPPDTDILAPDTETFDLYVFDGVPLPAQRPPGDVLVIDPRPAPELADASADVLFTVTGVFSNTTVTRLSDSPLLSFVDWSDVRVRQARAVNAPWTRVLVGSEGGPLLLVGEQGGHRVAILTFDLRDSDLPLRIAFPILMANITNWLSPGRAFDAPTGLRPGDLVTISPGAATTAVEVIGPDGVLWRREVQDEALLFADTTRLGLYAVSLRDATGSQPAGQFAVNLFSPEDSNLAVTGTIRLGQVEVAGERKADVGQRELWPWLALLAVGILAIEWWVYHRGPRLPRWDRRQAAGR